MKTYEHSSNLVDSAIATIVTELQTNDLTALSELLTFIHPEILNGYLETDKKEIDTDHWQRLRADYPAIERAIQ